MSTGEWSTDVSVEQGELERDYDPEDGGITIIRNACNHLPFDVA
jgi:hypothetical protein